MIVNYFYMQLHSPLATKLESCRRQMSICRSVDNLANSCGASIENIIETLLQQFSRFGRSTTDNGITVLQVITNHYLYSTYSFSFTYIIQIFG